MRALGVGGVPEVADVVDPLCAMAFKVRMRPVRHIGRTTGSLPDDGLGPETEPG
jgi:hypothetical protein